MGRRAYGTYVVIRSDGWVVVTDSLKDARRALRAKYRGCLKRYGNVHGSVFRAGRAKRVAGIYRLDSPDLMTALKYLCDGDEVLARCFHDDFVKSSRSIVKDKRPRRDPAVKVIEVDGNLRKKLEYIFRTKAVRSARHWDRLTDVKYCEFAKRYGVYVYDAGDGYRVYISVRKGATVDEMVESMAGSKLDLDLVATVLERVISLTECDDEPCRSVVELLRQIHAIATVLAQ